MRSLRLPQETLSVHYLQRGSHRRKHRRIIMSGKTSLILHATLKKLKEPGCRAVWAVTNEKAVRIWMNYVIDCVPHEEIKKVIPNQKIVFINDSELHFVTP